MINNNNNIVKYITGFIFLAIRLEKNSVLTEKISNCEVGKDDRGTLVANCKNTGINSIPQNLGANIEVLDISYNTKLALNKDDLKSYPYIWAFTMINTHITSIPAGFFQYTKDLQMVNISGTRITDLKEIPSSVLYFNYSYCDLEYVKLPQLENAEKVYLRNCTNLKKVPDLPITAPLKVLDVKYCSLIEANYSHIAAFCQLQYFGVDSKDISTPNHLERCCGFVKWSKMHNFEVVGYKYQKCNGSEEGCFFTYQKREDFGKSTIFDFNITQASLNVYADCWRAILKRRFFIILGLILIALLLLAFVGFILYFVVKAKMKARRQQLESDFLSPSEVEAESEPEAGSIRDSETESTRGTSDKG